MKAVKNLKNLGLLLLTINFLGIIHKALAYDERGNGSDNQRPEHDSAWFVGQHQTIRYCAQIAPSFGVDEAIVKQELQFAWKSWNELVAQKVNPQFGLPDTTVAENSELVSDCKGADVTFYFGLQTDEVKNHMSSFDNPSAFSIRTNFDLQKGWGRGFVWVAPKASIRPDEGFPDWSLDKRLRGIILHEIGHIYGCGHADGTIMTPWLDIYLDSKNGWLNGFWDKIEHRAELVDYTRLHRLWRSDISLSPATLAFLMKRQSKGRVRVELEQNKPNEFYEFRLLISDDQGTEVVEFSPRASDIDTDKDTTTAFTGANTGVEMFKIVNANSEISEPHESGIHQGFLVRPSDVPAHNIPPNMAPAIVYYNYGKPLSIVAVIDGQFVDIFQAKTVNYQILR